MATIRRTGTPSLNTCSGMWGRGSMMVVLFTGRSGITYHYHRISNIWSGWLNALATELATAPVTACHGLLWAWARPSPSHSEATSQSEARTGPGRAGSVTVALFTQWSCLSDCASVPRSPDALQPFVPRLQWARIVSSQRLSDTLLCDATVISEFKMFS